MIILTFINVIMLPMCIDYEDNWKIIEVRNQNERHTNEVNHGKRDLNDSIISRCEQGGDFGMEDKVSLGEDMLLIDIIDQLSALDGEVGKRLNDMVAIPHIPKIKGEIPSADEEISDHHRLLDRLQLYGLVEYTLQDGNCQNSYANSLMPSLYRLLRKAMKMKNVHFNLSSSMILFYLEERLFMIWNPCTIGWFFWLLVPSIMHPTETLDTWKLAYVQLRSLSDQLYRSQDHHRFVRQQVVFQLKSNPEMYEGYVPMAYGGYLKKMNKNGESDDHVTLQAAADLRVRKRGNGGCFEDRQWLHKFSANLPTDANDSIPFIWLGFLWVPWVAFLSILEKSTTHLSFFPCTCYFIFVLNRVFL